LRFVTGKWTLNLFLNTGSYEKLREGLRRFILRRKISYILWQLKFKYLLPSFPNLSDPRRRKRTWKSKTKNPTPPWDSRNNRSFW